MSKKKKKKAVTSGSVLDEPILRPKEPEEKESEEPSAEDNVEAPLFFAASDGAEPPSNELPEDDNGDKPSDGIPEEFEDDFPDDYADGYPDGDGYRGEDYFGDKPPMLERLIGYTSSALSVFMLGASLVFWYVMLRYLLRSPYALADPPQIRVLLAGCALFPAAVALVQHRLRRPVSAERWLICLCIAGALTTLLVIVTQTLVRHAGYTISELPLTLCCAVSGCALPAALFLGLRMLIFRFRRYLRIENGRNWETVRRDVLSLTDFGRI